MRVGVVLPLPRVQPIPRLLRQRPDQLAKPSSQTFRLGATMSSDHRAELEEKYKGFVSSFPKVEAIDVKSLHSQLQGTAGKPCIIDVRTPEEQQVSVIPGAVPRDVFEAHKEEYRKTPLVTYCTVGFRSGKYAQQLMDQGFDVKNLKGSIIAWTQEGYPLVKDTTSNEPTKRVHIFGEQWKLQGEGYEAVWFAKPKSYFEMVRSFIPRWVGGSS